MANTVTREVETDRWVLTDGHTAAVLDSTGSLSVEAAVKRAQIALPGEWIITPFDTAELAHTFVSDPIYTEAQMKTAGWVVVDENGEIHFGPVANRYQALEAKAEIAGQGTSTGGTVSDEYTLYVQRYDTGVDEGMNLLSAKAFEVCPKCERKGVYLVSGYDPNPSAGPLYRCQYCDYTSRNTPKSAARTFAGPPPVQGDNLVHSNGNNSFVNDIGTCEEMIGWDATFDCAPDALIVNLGVPLRNSITDGGIRNWNEVMDVSPGGQSVTLRPLDSDEVYKLRNATLYWQRRGSTKTADGLMGDMANSVTKWVDDKLPESLQDTPGNNPSYDWCRFRENQRCLFPVNGTPQDNGYCHRQKWDLQQACTISEPGPESGHPRAQPSVTLVNISKKAYHPVFNDMKVNINCQDCKAAIHEEPVLGWVDDEGNDICPAGLGGPHFPKYPSLTNTAADRDDQWYIFYTTAQMEGLDAHDSDRFAQWATERGETDATSALYEWESSGYVYGSKTAVVKEALWSDIQAKAKRIHNEGKVRIVAVKEPWITAEVQGDEATYQTTIMRSIGSKSVAQWECGCAWSNYSWGRSGRWKRYEGRMCSHALALTYEAQSREFGGGTISEDREYGQSGSYYFDPFRQDDLVRAAGLRPLVNLIKPRDEDAIQLGAIKRFAHIKGASGPFGAGEDDYEAMAEQLVQEAAQEEQQVSPVMQDVARRFSGELEGFGFRLKEKGSLADKLHRKSIEKGISGNTLFSSVNDMLRYTMAFPELDWGHSVQKAMWAIEERGYRIVEGEIENYWPRGDAYSGLHSLVQTPSGYTFELQFHTSDSFNLKQNIIHDLYDEFRKPETPLARKQELFDIMTPYWDAVGVPQNALDFPNMKGHPRPASLNPRVAELIKIAYSGDQEYDLAEFARDEEERKRKEKEEDEGAEALLHDEPEAALPSTDGFTHILHHDAPAPAPQGQAEEGECTWCGAHQPYTAGNTCRRCGHELTPLMSSKATAQPFSDPEDLANEQYLPEDESLELEAYGAAEEAPMPTPSDQDIAAHAQQVLAKMAAKVFTPSEQAALINEKGKAGNLDLLQIEGTHYELLGEDDEEMDWLT